MSREAEDHPHVHFQEASDGVKTNEIVIKRKSENKLEVQLGNFCVHIKGSLQKKKDKKS